MIHNQKIESLNKKLFILVDEAQFDKRWAVAAKSIFDGTKNIFIVITGSSALALNIDTDTARRAIKEPLYPLSFMEYQVIKNGIFPQRGNADNFKKLIFNNDRNVINDLNESIKKLHISMSRKGLSLEKELNDYLTLGGFPYIPLTTKEVAYRRIVDMINRIVSQDLPEISNFETGSIPEIMRIIGAIALTPFAELSQTKLSNKLGISSAKVNTIIDTLQKTHLIFTVKAFSVNQTKGSLIKGFKYYFISPTLSSAIKYMNGATVLS
ncbi:MAG: AAA family ATPase, partial [Nanoarchaeota archaeon]